MCLFTMEAIIIIWADFATNITTSGMIEMFSWMQEKALDKIE